MCIFLIAADISEDSVRVCENDRYHSNKMIMRSTGRPPFDAEFIVADCCEVISIHVHVQCTPLINILCIRYLVSRPCKCQAALIYMYMYVGTWKKCGLNHVHIHIHVCTCRWDFVTVTWTQLVVSTWAVVSFPSTTRLRATRGLTWCWGTPARTYAPGDTSLEQL